MLRSPVLRSVYELTNDGDVFVLRTRDSQNLISVKSYQVRSSPRFKVSVGWSAMLIGGGFFPSERTDAAAAAAAAAIFFLQHRARCAAHTINTIITQQSRLTNNKYLNKNVLEAFLLRGLQKNLDSEIVLSGERGTAIPCTSYLTAAYPV